MGDPLKGHISSHEISSVCRGINTQQNVSCAQDLLHDIDLIASTS